jgi:hypothetical protein
MSLPAAPLATNSTPASLAPRSTAEREGLLRLQKKLRRWQPALAEEIDHLEDNALFLMALHSARGRAERLSMRRHASAILWKGALKDEAVRLLVETPIPTRDAAAAFQLWQFVFNADIMASLPENERPRRWKRAIAMGFALGTLLMALAWMFPTNLATLQMAFWGAAPALLGVSATAVVGFMALRRGLGRFNYALLALEGLPALAGATGSDASREAGRRLVRLPLAASVGASWIVGFAGCWLLEALGGGDPWVTPAQALATIPVFAAALLTPPATLALFARSPRYDFDNIDRLAQEWRDRLSERE